MGLFDFFFGSGSGDSSDNDPSGPNHGDSNSNYGPAIHGTDSEGKQVTTSFGRDGGRREGHTLISDGHVSDKTFWSNEPKGHDHADGKGGYNDRGKYSGRK